MQNLKDFTYKQLEEFILSLGENAYRAGQIFKWLSLGVSSFDEMTDIPKKLRAQLAEKSHISSLQIADMQSAKDGTKKYLWRLVDGQCIESVLLKYKHGYSICISTQAGCAMGCTFCASTIGGKIRNLTPGEMQDQIIFASKSIGERISHVVLMGIGEPLDNYENVITFLKNVGCEKGQNMSYRNISLSTCGIVPQIDKLAEEKMPITLSVSLHAPTDAQRSEMMPINKKYPIIKLLEACRHYIHETGRRISFEYALIMGVNDSAQSADTLALLLRGMLCHVNIIPINSSGREGFVRPSTKAVAAFVDRLNQKGINATIRRELGSDIKASCGQLRRSEREDRELI